MTREIDKAPWEAFNLFIRNAWGSVGFTTFIRKYVFVFNIPLYIA